MTPHLHLPGKVVKEADLKTSGCLKKELFLPEKELPPSASLFNS